MDDVEIQDLKKIDSINREYNAKESPYETNAPIDVEKLANRIYASKTDVDAIKEHLASSDMESLEKNSKYFEEVDRIYKAYNELYETTKQFRDSLDNFINEKEYLENEVTRQDILNGEEAIKDVSHYISKEDDGYFKQTVLPKIQAKFTKLIVEINNQINEKISTICENLKTTCNLEDENVVDFLNEYDASNDYKVYTNNLDEEFYQKIELEKDNNRILKLDSKAYNRAKALTKSPEIFNVIINNENGDNIILDMKGREHSITKNPNNGEPRFPFILKSNAENIGDIKVSSIKGNFNEEGKNIYNHYIDNIYEIAKSIYVDLGVTSDDELYTKNSLKKYNSRVDDYTLINIMENDENGAAFILDYGDSNSVTDNKNAYYENSAKAFMEEVKIYYEGSVTDNANANSSANSVQSQTTL